MQWHVEPALAIAAAGFLLVRKAATRARPAARSWSDSESDDVPSTLYVGRSALDLARPLRPTPSIPSADDGPNRSSSYCIVCEFGGASTAASSPSVLFTLQTVLNLRLHEASDRKLYESSRLEIEVVSLSLVSEVFVAIPLRNF
jgi:hypothetical protein